MKIKNILIAFLLISFASPVFSQDFIRVKRNNFKIVGEEEGFREAKKMLRKGDSKFRRDTRGGYTDALTYYLKASDYNEDNARLNYLIGISYLKSADKKKALKYLENADLLSDEGVTKDIKLWLGVALKQNYKFSQAITHFENYFESLEPRDREKQKGSVDKLIFECTSGIDLMEKPVRCFIDNLGNGVNTPMPEYSPVFNMHDSVLYFTSRRENTTGGRKNGFTDEYFEDVYVSYKKGGKWRANEQMPKRVINTKGNDAVVDVSGDGYELCIYRGKKGEGELYNSPYRNGKWQKNHKMRKINTRKGRESSVSITPDSLFLFFISDRKGGQGGKDIWMSMRTQNGDKWQKPENLGPEINSPYDEETIKVSSDGKSLYFSSKGHNSMGGYDVFISKRNDDGTWSEPKNAGYPINTPDDDINFMMTPDLKTAYYSATRDSGFGDKDIYQIRFLGKEKPVLLAEGEDDYIACILRPVSESEIEKPVNIKIIQLSMFKGTVTDAYSGKPLEATIELVDNATGDVVKVVTSYAATGAFSVPLPPGKDYALTAGAPDYFFHSESFTIADTSIHEVIQKDIQLQPMGIGAKIVLNNVFFDSGKSKLRPESFTELQRLVKILQLYPNLVVEISGHTDSKGSASYNQKLSQRRAQACVDFIVSEGIKSSSVVAHGYGEDQARADNTTEEGRQLNRRVEAKILAK